jgi:hypothetical protein
MQHAALALLLSTGLVATGCAHGGSTPRARHVDGATTLLALGGATLVLGVLVAAMTAGTHACEDPYGRCGNYPLPPPEPR